MFIIPSLAHGGAENQVIMQCNALYERGWQVYLCVLSSKITLFPLVKIPATNILLLDIKTDVFNLKGILATARVVKALHQYINHFHIDQVVANLPLSHWYSRVLKLANPRVKLFIYHRSLQYDASPLNTPLKIVFNFFQSSLARITDSVSICISQAVRENISRNFTLKNPVILYNSVPDRYLDFEGKLANPILGNLLHIVFPGRLHPSKGHLFFLSVLKELDPAIREKICVIIAGGGILEDQILENIVSSNMQGIIQVTGFIENRELLKLVYDSNFVVIPSIHEGLGNVAIESLMLGKTVIASNAGGLKEIIQDGENGYMFEVGRREQLIEVLERVIKQYPNSIKAKDKLRESYLNRFSLDSHLERLAVILT
ncbi:glycosyltransferase family 4 protein [Pseudocnuella soli]|uniref:glycosyltransferase family 4 protein n=1 Tax=Pseudocnuella soli TaxID=2502779 RepID=UPI001404899E|nr:glycosyltransferase family 4 protein [Pseudocnuella soli]